MRTSSGIVLAMIIFLGPGGCAKTPIVGHGTNTAGRYFGELGISGNGSVVTIESGSDVSKLSIVGDGCKITVDDGAQVRKIEFWGNGSTVTIPDNLEVSIAAMGSNQVIRRPVGNVPAIHHDAASQPSSMSPH